MRLTGGQQSALWGAVTAVAVASYAAVSVTLAGRAGMAMGPLSIAPVTLAAWAFGARGGTLVALLLVPLHLFLFQRDGFPDGLTMGVFINAITLPVGFSFGFLFDRLRASLRHMRECQERYERAARGANDGLWEWDVERGRAHFSARFCELLGYAPEALGRDIDGWLSRVHPDDRPMLDQVIADLLAGNLARLDHEHRVRTADDGYLWVQVLGTVSAREGARAVLVTGWTRDASARRSQEQELRFHAFRDSLTGLANRGLFSDRLRQALLRCRATPRGRLAVLLIDLDRFKRVNDSLGHAAGDGLLLAVAARLRACVRGEDTVARLGGDEFAILLPEVTLDQDAIEVAERVRRALLEPITLRGRTVSSGSSVGIVIVSGAQASPQDILRDADTAMYRAKAQRRGQWALFDPSMRERAMQRLTLESELRTALSAGQFEVYYQPILDGSERFAGIEALPRWHHPGLGLLLPADFIELAEETGLIMDLGDLVLSHACSAGLRIEELLRSHPFTVHVNLSPKQIRRPDLIERIDAVLALSKTPPERLCVEISEDVIFEEGPAGGAWFEAMRARGIRICMDDFGTGYSSLSYLHRFRVDFLKVENAFVQGTESREGGVQIVRSLVNLARGLGVEAIAEGVETRKQWETLRALGCPLAQGYYFAQPMPLSNLLEWIRARDAACA